MSKIKFLILILIFLSCRKEDIPIIVNRTIGLSLLDSDSIGMIKISDGDSLLKFDINYSGAIEVDNKHLIKKISCEGDFLINLNQLSEACPDLNTLLAQNKTVTFGDISKLPQSVEIFDVSSGIMTGTPIFGDHMRVFRIGLGHTIQFDLSDLPESIENVCINSGIVTGEINENFPQMKRFLVFGENTISGDYGKIKGPFPATFGIRGNNTINWYSFSKAAFSETVMSEFIHRGTDGHALPTFLVDELLIDLANSEWSNRKRIEISGSHEPRSNMSSSAVRRLEQKGVTVITN